MSGAQRPRSKTRGNLDWSMRWVKIGWTGFVLLFLLHTYIVWVTLLSCGAGGCAAVVAVSIYCT
ncbi:hypothetical protein F4824DRAFT_449565 [Ustulina deusta]|nr:hypothetical protein F4824DRAFT_449565 [Ustulina deusta]